jgi:short-subunit dehydrogenase
MVITGASSGIDLVAARQAARQGARVLLVSRNEDAMRAICDDIRSRGGKVRLRMSREEVERACPAM